MLPRLITIPFSHYCEKARWALDHAGVAYVEEPYLPGFHMPAMRKAGGRTVPLLVLADRTLDDSAAILAYADAHATASRKLYPESAAAREEVARLEARFNEGLGKATRLLAYHHLLGAPRRLLDAVRPSLTQRQAAVFPMMMRLLRPVIRARYGVRDARALEALETTRACFAEVGAHLGPARGDARWLVGDRFTAADLTFASLGALVVAPEGHPSLGPVEAADGAWREVLNEMRATPAGSHVLRLYREERGARARPSG